jgi:hypothetical protein
MRPSPDASHLDLDPQTPPAPLAPPLICQNGEAT